VCSENVTDYNHFGDVGQGRCPLHENVEDRHEKEVKTAADEAMAKVRADNPGLADADLMIKVSDRVKQAEDARKGRAQVEAIGFPYHMVNDRLQQRAAIGAQQNLPPPPPPPVHRQYVHFDQFGVAPIPVPLQPVQPLQPLQPVQPFLPFQAWQPYQPNQPFQAPDYGNRRPDPYVPFHRFTFVPSFVYPFAPPYH
jgi:TRIAD3 protein (E3 ubiquitin-protein ligase RNF216)